MNRNRQDELDRILLSEEILTPSSGFAVGVMEAVREAASEPPPFPFPWPRLAAGVVGCSVWAASVMTLVKYVDLSVLSQPVSQLVAVAPELGYAAVAVGLSLALLRVHRTFAGE
jgi:hypothetical protein